MLIAVQDRDRHNTPPYAYGVVKMFFLCEAKGGHFERNIETTESGYFAEDAIPTLAEEKCDLEQVRMCFAAMRSGGLEDAVRIKRLASWEFSGAVSSGTAPVRWFERPRKRLSPLPRAHAPVAGAIGWRVGGCLPPVGGRRMIVCKFGGTSLADATGIRRAAAIVRADSARRFVVVSAPGKALRGG